MKALLYYTKALGLLLSTLLFTINGLANDGGAIFQHYTTRQGLSQNDINCLFQDSQGLLWMGTNDGLSSFDGYTFKDYRMDTHDIPSNLINKIIEDDFGNLWLGTADAGLCRFNLKTEVFTTFGNTAETPKLITKNNVYRMVLDKQGNLWFGNTKGLNCVKKEYLNQEKIKVNKYRHNKHNQESLHANIIRDLLVDSQGRVLVANGSGLQQYMPPTGKDDYGSFKDWNIYLKKRRGVMAMTEGENSIIIAFFDGIYELKVDKDGRNSSLKRLSNLKCDVIIKDINGIFWAGSKRGLFRLKYDLITEKLIQLDHYNKDEYLNSNIVHTIYEDKTGIIWIGTVGGGIKKYNPRLKKFRHIQREDEEGSLSYNKVRSVYEDTLNRLWVGTEGGGLNYLSADNKDYENGFKHISLEVDKRSQNTVYDINEFRNNLILGVGYPLKIVAKSIDQADKIGQNLRGNSITPPFLTNSVFITETEGDSVIWLGSYGGGLIRGIIQEDGNLDWQRIKIARKEAYKDPIEVVRNILVDKKGNVWVGTNQGLLFISKSQKHLENPQCKLFSSLKDDDQSLSYNYILPLFEASNGEIWIGTMGGGLNIITPQSSINDLKFEHLSTQNGLPSNVIKAILEDDYGNLWVSSNKGLSKISLDDRRVKNFDVSDGLQDNEFGELTAIKRRNGELIFGGVNGINVFYPHEIVDDKTIADLVFTDLKVLNKEVNTNEEFESNNILEKSIRYTDHIVLNSSQNSFAVRFAYLHYASPNKNKYLYKLEGYDKDWITSDAMQREAKYTNLSAGTYKLLVKASNGDHIWNPKPIELSIEILPPLWLTWWAKLFYVIVVIGIVYFFSIYTVINARKKSQLEMVKFEHEKLEDLSQLKLQFFTNISHELRTPLTLINTPVEQLIKRGKSLSEYDREKSYQLIHKNIQHLMRLVNQLLDFRKVEQGKMSLHLTRGNWSTFAEQVYFSFKEFAEQTNITLNYRASDDKIFGLLDTDKVEKILYNLLSNAFKFTNEGEISMSVTQENEFVKITLEDTGIGIPKEQIKFLFDRFYQVEKLKNAKHRGTGIGLAFTKSLVDLHHGEITVDSKVNKGTIFTLTFPLDDMMYSHDHIEESAKEAETPILEDDEMMETSTKAKILVIDDNFSIREMMKDLLKDTYDVYLADNGKNGLDLAKKIMPNLIISDIMMPEMDGYELTQRIREDNHICHLPIILLTAKKSEESKLKGYEYGVDAYVTKPFNSEVLLARILTLIENRKNQQNRFRVDIDIQPSEITFTSLDEKFLNRLVKIVEDNISDSEFTVEKLAMEYGVTTLRLNQKLKALTGQTAKGFIRNIRLKRAAQLLKLGRFNVSDVTYEVGFNDLKYFRNCFKKEFGLLPSQYAKEKRAEEAEEVE
ncbi:response regulator [Flammeovirga yaeyamensis]|uniref:histidine kinase n=1 Tax=Flammeovirga yaeyamensis TaxID=367791 RepID=A0AAX1NF61_9BACT|nr:two-component regulator propeller domain-containing protein [Flammeovirga yaeyamensis]MBB3696852.1 signal transduction histidine kinase/ligand-binding sensor domain-containing protein/DNA-binding response OmpR family regulator [Flammeovirga yaeyamensis]NMF33518.1 response regulator [Flammeovirga yaeyamensis]QWG05212.1 response regulator [Flammeovirga yaeyamensis]